MRKMVFGLLLGSLILSNPTFVFSVEKKPAAVEVKSEMKLDPDQIWKAYLENVEASKVSGDLVYSKEFLEIIEPTVKALPEILKDQLEKKVTFDSVGRARITYLKYCLNNGSVDKLLRLWGLDAEGAFVVKEMIKDLVERFEETLKDAPAILEARGVTEEDVMLSRLSKENFEKYKKGNLTIGDLIASQPSLIVNDD